ncbi:MAG TPA: NAD(P)/FAD-dependent oxidoreductase [Solirubrobacteraceae bacterium]|nr:NAD(P)/FAD-dependent oxidoreductase [Solirubrobacteraceae bacterium]
MRTTSGEHLDVLIVGAGLSGVGAACHLQRRCPDRSWAILEAREDIGGTWDLFRYPGIRSDSDMHTLGYSFAPWEEAEAIADGGAILRYIRRTAERYGVRERIRTGHRVERAEWSGEDAVWTVTVRRGGGAANGTGPSDGDRPGETERITCDFLMLCTGYYRYDRGYTPEFPGVERFRGRLVHPQLWPEDLDYAGRRVVVIGSGATAVTLVPAMAQEAGHVTMLQRSPSYVLSVPGRDELAQRLRRHLPATIAYGLVRWRNVVVMTLLYQLSRRRPRLIKRLLRRGIERELPVGYDVDTHFRPRYEPWDQRMCFVPDGDLFAALRSGRASIVTDRIETFTEAGVKLAGGRELEADIVVTATGLQLLALGGIDLVVDGRDVHLPERMAYKGMMLSGVPNMAFAIGYTNASWTLKADLTAQFVCRLLTHMRDPARRVCMPVADDPAVAREPLINLASGYVLRSVKDFPAQGSRRPWRVHQNYALDLLDLRWGELEDGVLRFSRAGTAAPSGEVPVLAAT